MLFAQPAAAADYSNWGRHPLRRQPTGLLRRHYSNMPAERNQRLDTGIWNNLHHLDQIHSDRDGHANSNVERLRQRIQFTSACQPERLGCSFKRAESFTVSHHLGFRLGEGGFRGCLSIGNPNQHRQCDIVDRQHRGDRRKCFLVRILKQLRHEPGSRGKLQHPRTLQSHSDRFPAGSHYHH